ncbi:MAG: amidohydrolase family protein [Planctomycetota bacterium]
MHDSILKPTSEGDGMIDRFRNGLFCFFAVQWLFASWASAHPGGVDQAGPYDLIVTGGWVFDTPSGTFIRNQGIGISQGRFETLKLSSEPDQSASLTSDGRRVELGDDQYILPGLVDCHAHYNVKLFKRRREEFEVMPIVYLANGSTVTFSCGEFNPEKMEDLRRRIENGDQIGPKLINSGPYFGRARPGWRTGKPEQEIRAEVDHWAGRGVGGFKAKQIAPEELKVLIEQAHQHGLTVTGHLDSGFRNSVNPRDAIDMGIDRIEHFLGGDAMPGTNSAYDSLGAITADMPEYQAIVRKFIEHGTVFDATLTAYGYFGYSGEEFGHWYDEGSLFTPYVQKSVKEREPDKADPQFVQIYLAKLATIAAFHEAGGTITLGTDHVSNGNYLPGFGAHRELDAFVRGGISAADAIRIGTINGARALRIDRDHGSIETGKVADFFVVNGNPLENIRNTRNVQWVSTSGRLYSSPDLLNRVKGNLGPSSEEEQGEW